MFDPRLLTAFVKVAETGSFTLAAGMLNMTQSTVSQQIARLEEAAGRALLDRAARPVRLTPAGERLIGYARRIIALQAEAGALMADPSGTAPVRIGMPDDLAGPAVIAVLAGFAARNPKIRLDVTAGLSRDLTRRYRDGALDIVIVKETAPEPDSIASFPEPLAWYETAERRGGWPDPLPLVTFPPGGLYRGTMFEQLDQAQRPWYVAFSSSSLNSVLSAVEAGLGVSLVPSHAARGRRLRAAGGFGAVAGMAASLYAWEPQGALADLVQGMTEVLARRYAEVQR